MSEVPMRQPEGWEYVLNAAEILDKLVEDLFRLPEVANDRGRAAGEASPEDHGDDLLCGCWAAPEMASALLQLLGRHLHAALILTRTHAAFTTPISTLARTVIEQGVRIAWLLGSDDVHTRERRYFEFQKEELRLQRNLGRMTEQEIEREEKSLRELLADFPGTPLSGIPSTETLCNDYGTSGGLYPTYRMFSQPIHATATGASSFHFETRRALAELGRGSGEWLDAEFVGLPMFAMWEAAAIAMVSFRDLLAPEFECSSLDKRRDFERELGKVPPNAGWVASQPSMLGLDAAIIGSKLNRAQRRRLAKLRRTKHG